MALAPARPAAAELRDMPARWPEQTVARNYNRSDICGHTPIVPDDTRIEIRAIEEHSRDIGIANSEIIVAKPEQIHEIEHAEWRMQNEG
jgi:hypothetical protein